MRERSPVPCAQPSPRGDAPSPLAFAKSCKGGDVSVLDPALAWDVRCIYLFIYWARDWGALGKEFTEFKSLSQQAQKTGATASAIGTAVHGPTIRLLA